MASVGRCGDASLERLLAIMVLVLHPFCILDSELLPKGFSFLLPKLNSRGLRGSKICGFVMRDAFVLNSTGHLTVVTGTTREDSAALVAGLA
jgi:hypothetical protein